jgi:hypothetical protein
VASVDQHRTSLGGEPGRRDPHRRCYR